jgi:hypothetical protein
MYRRTVIVSKGSPKMTEFRFQSGIDGRGLTLRRRSLYLARALLGVPVFIRDFPAAKGTRQAKSKKSTQFMNDICNATNGSGLEFLDSIVKNAKRNLTKSFDSEALLKFQLETFLSHQTINQIVSDLDEFGCAVIRQWATRDLATQLKDQLDQISGSEYTGERFDDFDSWLKSGLKPRLVLDQQAVKSSVDNFNLDISGLMVVARKYLGSKPYLLGPQSWYTKPTTDRTDMDLEEAAMAFHCDSDFFGFVKAFLLCTDVTEENGPLAFLKGSHKGKRHVQGRLSDVQLAVRPEERMLATGETGDLFLVATKGWHKATPPNSGHRLMVQWLFSTGYFGSASY